MKKRWILLLVILCFILIARYMSSDVVSLGLFKKYHSDLLAFVHHNYFYAVFLYIVLYFFATALALPAVFVITMAGGYLFDVFPGVIYINIGATVGAITVFLVSRYLLGAWVQKQYREKLVVVNDELKRYGIYYLFMVRLIPIFPFFLINILAGITQITLFQFMWTTALGIIPASLVYAYMGKQILQIRSVHDILSLPVILTFIFLAILMFLPVILAKRSKRRLNQ